MAFELGVAASLTAPLVMTIGFMVWESQWKGSAFSLNLFKCNLASVGFLVIVLCTNSAAELRNLFSETKVMGYLFLSSVIGIIVGDWSWLQALQTIGARQVILMDSLKPFLAAFLGWLILDEELRWPAMAGIFLTVGGVLIVSLESTRDSETSLSSTTDEPSEVDRQREGFATEAEEAISVSEKSTDEDDFEPETKEEGASTTLAPSSRRTGYLMSVLNISLDTYGAVLIKQFGEGLTVWEINLLRFGFAGVVMILIVFVAHVYNTCVDNDQGGPATDCEDNDDDSTRWYRLPRQMTLSSWAHVSMGVLLVTFFTPALTNYALFQIAVALALTLGSVGPLYALSIEYVLGRMAPSTRSVVGSILAVAGIVVLALLG